MLRNKFRDKVIVAKNKIKINKSYSIKISLSITVIRIVSGVFVSFASDSLIEKQCHGSFKVLISKRK